MPQYLTSDWFEAANKALAENTTVSDATRGQAATVQQNIEGGPNGDIVMHISIDDGTVTLQEGPADNPDVTVTTDYETSAAMDKGEQNQMQAFMTGKVKADGNLMKVMSLQSAQGAIDEALRSIDTEY